MSIVSENKKQRDHYKNLNPPKYLVKLTSEDNFMQKEELIEKTSNWK